MARDPDAIPTSRLRRTAKIAGLAAGTAVKQTGTRAANVARSEDAAEAATARRQLETAEQIVTALGTMKGAAMKLGQVLSFLDVGFVPEEHREAFQEKLAALRDAAPNVSFNELKKVMEKEFGEKLTDVFASLQETPVAAASIGQVYRATLHDGRDVAVKVQYPGVATAVRADMQNLGMILRLMQRAVPGLDPKVIGDEIRNRIYEELDYELEAQNQRAVARIYRNHPFIVIPDVVTSLCHEKVIVSEWVGGRGFEAMQTLTAAERDRIGEIVFRFYFGCMYRHLAFSGDPHPGNMVLLDDGRMAFLDFGLFKRITREVADFELKSVRLGIAREGEALLDHLEAGGFVGERQYYTPEGILKQFHDLSWWYTEDAELTLTPRVASKVAVHMGDPRSEHFGKMRHETLPPDHLFGRRLEMLTLAVMSQLGATANWHAIAREWIYGDQPQTELGRLEAEFLG